MIGATENMPSGHALKPGDIVRAKTGTTIEIINTDAEGRLVLADCLAHAVELGAERIVDFATLTGAIVTTFGDTHAGLFGTDDAWCAAVDEAGARAGELVLAAAAARRLREGDRGPLRRHRQRGRDAQGGLDRGRRVPASASPATCRGRTSTSPARPGTPARPTRAKGGTGFGVRMIVELADGLAASE